MAWVLFGAGLAAPNASRAMDPPTDAAVTQLAAAIWRGPEAVQSTPDQVVGPVVYRLWAATRFDLSPESALTLAAQKAKHPLYEPLRGQILADWRMANKSGLLTPVNLSRLQVGAPTVASDGQFVGQQIGAAKIRPAGSGIDLTNLALCPAAQPIPDEALAYRTGLPPINAVWQPQIGRPFPFAVNTVPPGFRPPLPTGIAPGNPSAPRLGPAELHDVRFNDSIPLGGTRKLAVADVDSERISVSIIGAGPDVRINGPNGGWTYYPRVDNSKVPKLNPVKLPDVSGNAYLIHSEGQTHYYYVDVSVGNGGFFRIAKVWAYP